MNQHPRTPTARRPAPPPHRRAWKPGAPTTSAPAMTAVRTPAAAALTATLGLAAACWVVSVWRMSGMDMGWRPGWARAGVVVHAVCRPHGTAVAGAVAIAAGACELTPLKRHFRRRCQQMAGPGFGFGACCVGSSAALMAMLVALGVMSVTWMAVIAVLVTAH